MLTIYGIKNCDTMKKAFAWLDSQGVAYVFHDYKKSGISQQKLQEWDAALGWEALLNRKGSTWRKLDTAIQTSITQISALQLMQTQTSLIKRPVLEHKSVLLAGFDPVIWARSLSL
jgi:arsenate reductase (glutaredoxin)